MKKIKPFVNLTNDDSLLLALEILWWRVFWPKPWVWNGLGVMGFWFQDTLVVLYLEIVNSWSISSNQGI